MKVSYSQMMKSMSGADDLAPTREEIEADLAAGVLRDEITSGEDDTEHSVSYTVKILKAPDEDLPF